MNNCIMLTRTMNSPACDSNTALESIGSSHCSRPPDCSLMTSCSTSPPLIDAMSSA